MKMSRLSMCFIFLVALVVAFAQAHVSQAYSNASSSSSSSSSLSSLLKFEGLNATIRCDACKFLIKLVQDVEEGRVTLDVGKGAAKTFCEINGGGLGYTCTGSWQCKDVCGGAVDEFAPIVLEVLFVVCFS